ncbi:uncharacterized protein C8A04DRAFT_29907 [Dichotomopilus funicola]|uniref:Cell wall protein PhiA n=1 Tax=Dichotomopilus funicola TaxID=1934379 RepID=A0AAN6V063_9PEZI|nr:hypothetical protein C8A04DRAFT_29907 [Dichotomopilus funicola]
MQLTTTFTLLTSLAASVSAAALAPRDTSGIFSLLALHPNLPFNGQLVTASKSGLWLLVPPDQRDAQCYGRAPPNLPAVFTHDGDEVRLYGEGFDRQLLVVNTSADRQDNLKYFSEPVTNTDWQVGGWTESTTEPLLFQGNSWAACSQPDGTWKVGVSLGNDDNEECVDITIYPVDALAPVPCRYSQEQESAE